MSEDPVAAFDFGEAVIRALVEGAWRSKLCQMA